MVFTLRGNKFQDAVKLHARIFYGDFTNCRYSHVERQDRNKAMAISGSSVDENFADFRNPYRKWK